MGALVTTDGLSLRLALLGYNGGFEEAFMEYCIESAEQTAKSECNLAELSDDMRFPVTDLAAAMCLFMRKQEILNTQGELQIEGDGRIKSLKEGDREITYMTNDEGGVTAETRLDTLIEQLKSDALLKLAPFRRIAW